MNKWDMYRMELDSDLESGRITYEQYVQYNKELNIEEDEDYRGSNDYYRHT